MMVGAGLLVLAGGIAGALAHGAPAHPASSVALDAVRAWVSPTVAAGPLEPAAPLRLQADLPEANPNHAGPRPLPVVQLELRDATGAPAPYGAGPAPPQPMFLRGLPPYWSTDRSAPTAPGAYHMRLTIAVRGEPTQTLDLATPLVQVITPTTLLAAGLVYDRDGNLWLTAADGMRTRKLTFTATPARAMEPAWAPDGRRIAYVRGLPVPADQLPIFEIWSLRPDSSDDRPLVPRAPDENLEYAAWTPDGRLLFTVDRTSAPPPGALHSYLSWYAP